MPADASEASVAPAATTTSASHTSGRAKRVLRITGIAFINALLVAAITGLLIATWLPAYVYHNKDVKIGESYAK